MSETNKLTALNEVTFTNPWNSSGRSPYVSISGSNFTGSFTGTLYDPVSKPEHYCSGDIECIDAMISAYGIEAVKHFCICNAFKYLWRFNKKNRQQDIDKMKWYLSKYEELSKNEND